MTQPVSLFTLGIQGPPGPLAASVATPAAVSALAPPVAYPAGTMAFAQSTGQTFQLVTSGPNSTLTADGFTVLAVTAPLTGRWVDQARLAGGPILARRFGADPTGTADSGPSINAAMTSLAGTGIGLAFDGGTWLVNTAIVNTGHVPVSLGYGASFTGSRVTTLTSAAGGNVVHSERPLLTTNTPALQVSQIANEQVGLASIQFSQNNTGLGITNGAFSIETESALFLSTYDNVTHMGYNIFGQVATEPQCRFSVESNFEQSTNQRCVEMHIQCSDPAFPSFGFNRPFSMQYWRGDGRMLTGLQYSDGGHGAGTGSLSITEHSGSAAQMTWTTGTLSIVPANYAISATNGLTITSASAGSVLSLLAGGTNTLVNLDDANARTYFQCGGAVVFDVTSTAILFGKPIGGYVSTPVQKAHATQALGHGGTTTLGAAVYTCPDIALTDSGLTSAATVIFPTTAGPTEWVVDLTGVTFAASRTVTLEVGTASATVVVSAPAVLRIRSDGVGAMAAVGSEGIVIGKDNFGGTAIWMGGASGNANWSIDGDGTNTYVNATAGGTVWGTLGTAIKTELTASTFSLSVPLGGSALNALAFTWAGQSAPNTVACGTGGTQVVSAAQATLPFFLVTTGTLTSNAVVDFTARAPLGAFILDLAGVGALGAFTLGFKNGTTTVTLTASQLTALRAAGKTGVSVLTYTANGVTLV